LKQISQYPKKKTSIESLANRVEEVENRVSRTEDIVEELEQTVKDHEKILRKYEWTCKISGIPSKDQIYDLWV
jgi:predicted transcriptional regulator